MACACKPSSPLAPRGRARCSKSICGGDARPGAGLDARKIITLYDRGFAAFSLLRHHLQTGAPFVLRLPERWWKVARALVESGLAEQSFTLRAGAGHPAHALRLVRVETGDPAQPAVLATSLTDGKAFPAACFKELYAARWGVEEGGFKMLKCRARLEEWRAKTGEGIRQDFHAKVMTLNLSAALSAEASEEIRRRSEREVKAGRRKHQQRINSTHALAAVRRHVPGWLWQAATHVAGAMLEALNACFRRAVSLLRPGRSSPRPAYAKRMPATAYKPL